MPILTEPSSETLKWVTETMGPHSAVQSVRALPGARSTPMHALRVQTTSAHAWVVLRRYTDEEWLSREPLLAAREATVLKALSDAGFPAPRPLAVDPHGEANSGVPCVLMTMLRGTPLGDRQITPEAVDAMADVLALVHRLELSLEDQLPRYEPHYLHQQINVPLWTQLPSVWQAAIPVYGNIPEDSGRSFLHRDFHGGNLLWENSSVVGVVDWTDACYGPQWGDVGHARFNLAMTAGQTAADDFLRRYTRIAGLDMGDYDRIYDVASLVGCSPDFTRPTRSQADRMDTFLATAMHK